MNEEVMVVRRETVAPYIEHRTFDLIDVDIRELIESEHLFIPRATAEVSPQFKQIIPYVVIRNGESFFLLTRLAKQTEARLHHKLSLGIGGHINPDTPTVLGGLRKELEEEIHVACAYDLRFVGILNDDTTDVGRVHLGTVFELLAATRDVTIRETEKMTGEWSPRASLASMRNAMETWSQIVYDGFIAAK
jgi:predicted NUDIX family phosphoesterase